MFFVLIICILDWLLNSKSTLLNSSSPIVFSTILSITFSRVLDLQSKLIGSQALSAGNGDLPFYSTLGRLIAENSMNSKGWLPGFDLSDYLFGNWGFGGFSGGAALSFFYHILKIPADLAALPFMLSMTILMIFAIYTFLSTLGYQKKPSSVIALVSGLNLHNMYLVAQSFLLMLISMLLTLILITLITLEIKYKFSLEKRFWGFTALFVIIGTQQFFTYPAVAFPFLFTVFIWLILKTISIRDPNLQVQKKRYALLGISILLIPIVFFQHSKTLVQNVSGFALGDIAGWDLMIAKPFGQVPSFLQASWNHWDWTFLALNFLLLLITLLRIDSKFRILTGSLVSTYLILTAIFIMADGSFSYTSWKFSYYFYPLILALVLLPLVNSREFFRSRLLNAFSLLIFVFIILFRTGPDLIQSREILGKFPTDQINQLLQMQDKEAQTTFVALGALDQLWVAYYSRHNTVLLSQNVHIATKSSFFKEGDRLLTYREPQMADQVCRRDLSEFNKTLVSSSSFYKMYRFTSEGVINC